MNTSHTADTRGNFSEFIERQKKQIDNKENRYSQGQKDDNCTFKPKINVCSEFLVETNCERRGETKDSKVNRLYNEAKIKENKLKLIQECEKQSFAPKINDYSKNLKRTIDDLCIQKPKPDLLNDSSICDLDFKPKSFTKNSVWNKRVESNLNASRIDQALEKIADNKEIKLNQLKKELELQELSKCSFKPVTNKHLNPSKSSKHVDVKGMNK